MRCASVRGTKLNIATRVAIGARAALPDQRPAFWSSFSVTEISQRFSVPATRSVAEIRGQLLGGGVGGMASGE